MDEHAQWIYCVADEKFFDAPDRISDEASRFEAAGRPAPEGWGRGEADLWVGLEPPGDRAEQGWKVHVSVTLDDAAACIAKVWDFCVSQGLPFKFLRSTDAMLICNSKYAGRGSSGKLITIYPDDEAQLTAVLIGLSEQLAGMPGPYILGDLRIGDGPLYVRYGGYAEMWCQGDGGEPALAIRDDEGRLVPDRRGPVFYVPPWVDVPEVLRPHLEALKAGGPIDFPYRVREALHFSNSGGIYLATDGAGTQVVLREARPHAGLDRNRQDAVARLDREHDVLTRLAGLDCVPDVYERRVVQGHHFLAEEYIDGSTLLAAIQEKSPALYPDTPPATLARQIADYRRWAVEVLDRIAEAVDAIHQRGIRFGDLHPANIMLRPDDTVALIDFEFASDLDDETPPGLGAPGFAAPDFLKGAEVDDYALRCLRVFMFSVLTPIIDLDRSKAATVVAAAREIAGMPVFYSLDGYFKGPDRAAAFFGADMSWPVVRDSLVAGLHSAATPDRPDRLFPGGTSQVRGDGIGIAHGAAGVLLALHRAGAEIPETYTDWLVAAVRRSRPRPGLGLYNGPHGAAAVLDMLGAGDAALEALDVARRFDRLPTSDSLYGGYAGRALNLLHFGFVEEALRLGGKLAEDSGHGLMRGPSGHAVLFLRLAEVTGDERWLDRARDALFRDVERGTHLGDGSFQLGVGHRFVPYLDGGGGGVALALREYLRHRDEPAFSDALPGIRRSCTAPFVYQPGLFAGRAGMIATLALLGDDADRAALHDQVHRLGWHALLHDGNLVFPGEQLLRLSMDVATGSAGVLLALHTVFEDSGEFLPHLGARSSLPIPTP